MHRIFNGPFKPTHARRRERASVATTRLAAIVEFLAVYTPLAVCGLGAVSILLTTLGVKPQTAEALE